MTLPTRPPSTMSAYVLVPKEMAIVVEHQQSDSKRSSSGTPPHVHQSDSETESPGTPHPVTTTSTTVCSKEIIVPGTVFYPDEGEVKMEKLEDELLAEDDVSYILFIYFNAP